MRRRCLLPYLAVILLALPARGETISGTATATEGDTVTVNGGAIRLYGIDAPDIGQTCKNRRGQEYDCFELSRLALEKIINNRPVDCEIKPRSGSNRIGVCRVEGRDLAALIVMSGWALAYRRIAPDYAGDEAKAVSHRRGLWGGRVEPPWIWRDRQIGR